MPFEESEYFDPNLPLVETFDEAQHFRRGPSVVEHQIRPWPQPIPPMTRLEASAGGS
jgi:hydroxymethylglutaryl-CoA lyase